MNNQQLEAFNRFTKLKVSALFMEMGTGKTRVALELVNYNRVDLLIYVAPCSTLQNIKIEIDKWGINCDYKLIGYETISSSDTKYLNLLHSLDNKKCFIIADESIFIKNDETKRFKRLCQLRNKCEYALILNGTPLTKNEWDLYNQMYFLSPLILNMNREEFLNTFFKKIEYKKYHQKAHTFFKFSEVNAEYLNKLIQPYVFECKLEFDKSENISYKYIPYLNSNDYYIEKDKKINEFLETMNSNTIINMLTNLNIIASTYEEKNKEVANYIHDKQIIVFCNFLKEINYYKEHIDCYIITGQTKNRNEIINQFKNDSKPLIITYGIGSFSLNLQFCNEIVFSSINFDYAKNQQAKYRIKRIGQKNDIKYTYFLTDLGITKLIIDNLYKKKSLQDIIKEKLVKGEFEWLKFI